MLHIDGSSLARSAGLIGQHATRVASPSLDAAAASAGHLCLVAALHRAAEAWQAHTSTLLDDLVACEADVDEIVSRFADADASLAQSARDECSP